MRVCWTFISNFATFQEKYKNRWQESINRTYNHRMLQEHKMFQTPTPIVCYIQQPHEVRILLDMDTFNVIFKETYFFTVKRTFY